MIMENGSISSNQTVEDRAINNIWVSFSVFIMCVCCIFTMIGNFLVIVTVIRNRKGKIKLTNRFILSLAIADLCVGFFVLPSSIAKINNGYYWSKPLWFCKLWVTMDVGFVTVSIYNLIAISLDRLYAVYRPISYNTKRSTRMVNFMIFMSWIMFFVVAMPMHLQKPPFSNWNGWLYQFQPFNASGLPNIRENCGPPMGDQDSQGWILYASILAFILPAVFIILLNTLIFIRSRRFHVQRVEKAKREKVLEKSFTLSNKGSTLDNERSGVSDDPSPVSQHDSELAGDDSISSSNTLDRKDMQELVCGDESNKMLSIKRKKTKELTKAEKKLKREEAAQARMTTMMAVVIGAFMVCWAPFVIMFIAMIPSFGGHVANMLQDNEHIVEMITWLGYVNSFLNPIIYATMNQEMKKGFKDLLFDIKNAICRKK